MIKSCPKKKSDFRRVGEIVVAVSNSVTRFVAQRDMRVEAVCLLQENMLSCCVQLLQHPVQAILRGKTQRIRNLAERYVHQNDRFENLGRTVREKCVSCTRFSWKSLAAAGSDFAAHPTPSSMLIVNMHENFLPLHPIRHMRWCQW